MSVRRRILQSSLTVAVVAVVLLGVPLVFLAGVLNRHSAERSADAVAHSLGKAVDAHLRYGLAPDSVLSAAPEGYFVQVLRADAPVASHGSAPPSPVTGRYEGSDFTVVAQRPLATTYGEMASSGLLVLMVAALAVLAAMSLGLRQARGLAVPLVDLAHRAARLGSGGARPQFARYGIDEVDQVAAALERSAERVADMLGSERQFASDASHQLRTPLTALSMRLEEILETDDLETVREEARIALGQVERLTATVDHLLTVSRHSRAATTVPVPLDDVVAQQVAEWRPAFAAARRKVRVVGRRGLVICATPGGVSQVVATLLENSLKHGAGTVTIRIRSTGSSAVVEVGDEGGGVPPELGARVFERSVSGHSGTGLGLALARDLAEADGGRLELVGRQPAVFALFLAVPDARDRQGRPERVDRGAQRRERPGIAQLN